jgi:hypothetical protein
MAGEDQHWGHEPHYKPIRRLASGVWDSHACGSQVGKVYRTPINVFRAPNGFIVALTYSSQSEWVKNALAAGGCELKTRGKKYRLSASKVVRDPTRRRFPIPVRVVLKVVGADEYMVYGAFEKLVAFCKLSLQFGKELP